MHRRSRPSTRTRIAASLIAAALVCPALALAGCTAQQNGDAVTGIIPAPVEFELTGGGSFTLTEESRLVAEGEAAAVAETFAAQSRLATGFDLPVVGGEAGASDLELVIDPAAGDDPEAYTLESGADGVRVAAPAAAGLFWGTQTLGQLLPAEIERT